MKDLIEKELQKLCTGQFSPSLFQSARYALFSGGKRLRPLIALTTATSYGEEHLLPALQPACALEFIHTYSLIHDDLPCMDNDDLRRGKPTLHKVFPEAQALLTGDFLLTFAFQVLAEAPYLQPKQKLSLISTLSRAAGSEGMVGGQLADVIEKEMEIKLLESVHLRKTALLIEASFLFGAIVAKAPPKDQEILSIAGKKLGLAFQRIDDLCDEKKGEKSSILALCPKDQVEKEAKKLHTEAIEALKTLSQPAPALIEFADLFSSLPQGAVKK